MWKFILPMVVYVMLSTVMHFPMSIGNGNHDKSTGTGRDILSPCWQYPLKDTISGNNDACGELTGTNHVVYFAYSPTVAYR